MNFADWNPQMTPEVRRANGIAAEQHAANLEAYNKRVDAEREQNARCASKDAAFEEHLAEYRRRKADPWADQPDDALTPTAAIDKARAQVRADRESGANAAADERQRQFAADIDARNQQHQTNARAMQEWSRQALAERMPALEEMAAENARRAESTATIDEMRRQRKNRL
ncbi:hypothetical protein LCL87_17060 [Rhodococcus hoagii]|nr:hypothetical protein [Prescottella equi]